MSLCALLAALVFGGATAAIALSVGSSVTVASAPEAKLAEQVLVSAQGRTLYALSPETASHLLCRSSECLKFWPPVTVTSRKTKVKAGQGVEGRFGILRRSDGMLQITFRGLPLYRYSGDRAKGEVNGEGLRSFGGTWHVLRVGPLPANTAAPEETTGTSTSNAGSGSAGGYEGAAHGTTSTSPSTTTTSTTTTSTSTSTSESKSEEPPYW